MKQVLIVVPTTDQQVSSEIANLFGMAHGRNPLQSDYKFSTSIMEGVRPVSAARNAIAKFFLDSPADILWMIDQDIVPCPDVFKLLDVDADIVAPMMPTMRSHTDHESKTFRFEFPICAINYRDFDDMTTGEDPDLDSGGIMEVDGVGFGCTIIHRHVLEDKRLWGSREFTKPDGRVRSLDKKDPPPIFNYRVMPNGCVETGEDYDFCYRAKKLGYTVKLHADIMVGHIRQVDLQRMLGVREILDLREDVKQRKAV